MHSTGTDKVTFLHNSDFSGDVTIVGQAVLEGPPPEEITLPFDNLEYIVTEKKRTKLIEVIEDLDLSRADDRRTIEALYLNMIQVL